MQILRIDSSTNGESSVSRILTDAITKQLSAQNPGATITKRDLSADPLPHFDPARTEANRQPPEDHGAAAAAVWQDDEAVLDEFLASDIVVIGAPMYNFSLPSQLKAWLDRLAVPRRTFRYGPNGPEGLAGGRRVIVGSARGGAYGDDSPMDFQENYLRTFFGFIGIDNLEIVRAEGVAQGEDVRADAIVAARKQIAQL